jgi:hypothetical protein
VTGGGALRLEDEGIEVVLGCLAADATRLIAEWCAREGSFDEIALHRTRPDH